MKSRHMILAASMPLLAALAWCAMSRGFGVARLPWNVSGLILTLLLAFCAATDAIRGKIYNVATYPAMLWALAINLALNWPGSRLAGSLETFAPLGSVGPASCLLGGLACFAVMVASFLTAGGGGGDVKLATAIGLLIGVERGLAALVYTYIAAAAFSLAYLAMLGALGTAAWIVSSRLRHGRHAAPARDAGPRRNAICSAGRSGWARSSRSAHSSPSSGEGSDDRRSASRIPAAGDGLDGVDPDAGGFLRHGRCWRSDSGSRRANCSTTPLRPSWAGPSSELNHDDGGIMQTFDDPLGSVRGITVLWACSVVGLAWLIVAAARRARRNLGRLRDLSGEDGFAYSLGFLLTMPFLMVVVALVVETTLLLASKAGTFYAAYAAARSAIVWDTAQPPGVGDERIRLAAVHAIAPFASSNPAHLSGDLEDSASGSAISDYVGQIPCLLPGRPARRRLPRAQAPLRPASDEPCPSSTRQLGGGDDRQGHPRAPLHHRDHRPCPRACRPLGRVLHIHDRDVGDPAE